ncbi:hypothetical protein [Lactobacillus paragasseri]|uniref:hypothetical protein n=1 Tax=Lactobacillus paragasseri TaxID=2107999 RepID=UPI0022E106DA|nr:hypothetical protein [Lactobacillus paragasseri]
MIEKEKVLSDAPKALNSDNNPWEVAVEGDSIIGTWKWMDARFFTEGGTFTVTLKDNGKWKEVDSTSSKTSSIRMHNGKLSFSKDISFSKGKTLAGRKLDYLDRKLYGSRDVILLATGLKLLLHNIKRPVTSWGR